MKHYTFTVKRHEEYGELGFAPSWYPQGEPLHGIAVAHDILEHFPHDDGSPEGELQALGAMYWIRGETGYLQRNGNVNRPEVHIASDFPMLWDYMTERDERTSLRPSSTGRDRKYCDIFNEIAHDGTREIMREREGVRDISSTFQVYAAGWLYRGYQRARRRYRGLNAHSIVYDLFQPIEETSDRLLKQAEEGQQLTVRLSLKSCDVSLDLTNQEEYSL